MVRDDENQVGSNLVAVDGTVEKREKLDIMRVIEMAGLVLESVRVDKKVRDQEGLKKDIGSFSKGKVAKREQT